MNTLGQGLDSCAHGSLDAHPGKRCVEGYRGPVGRMGLQNLYFIFPLECPVLRFRHHLPCCFHHRRLYSL